MRKISIEVRFKSLNEAAELVELPVQIRRSDMSLVRRDLTNRSIEIDVGEYVISCRLPTGNEIHRTITVTSDKNQTFEIDSSSDIEDLSGDGEKSGNINQSPKVERIAFDVDILGKGLMGTVFDHSEVRKLGNRYGTRASERLQLRCYRLTPERAAEWLWAQDISEQIRNDKEFVAPFPIELRGPFVYQLLQSGMPGINVHIADWRYDNYTKLKIEPSKSKRGKYELNLKFGIQRVDVLMSYLRHNLFDQTRQLLQLQSTFAEQLLEEKRANPLGAAVGAYALLKLGNVAQLHDWTGNLFNWFPWLPDGAAIHGEFLARNGQHKQALNAFLKMGERGLPTFSDGLSYALDRLRIYTTVTDRQSDQIDVKSAKALLERLIPYATHSDFNQSFLTYTGINPLEPDGKPWGNFTNVSWPRAGSTADEMDAQADILIIEGDKVPGETEAARSVDDFTDEEKPPPFKRREAGAGDDPDRDG
jgi:hypothetical protein